MKIPFFRTLTRVEFLMPVVSRAETQLGLDLEAWKARVDGERARLAIIQRRMDHWTILMKL